MFEIGIAMYGFCVDNDAVHIKNHSINHLKVVLLFEAANLHFIKSTDNELSTLKLGIKKS